MLVERPRRPVLARTVVMLALVAACNNGGGKGDPAGTTDPYEGLRSLSTGEIRCNGDNCCLFYCAGQTDGTDCITRDPAQVLSMIENAPAECTGVTFPEWFYAHDCFVGDETKEAGTSEWTVWTTSISDGGTYGQLVYFPIECLCGRSASAYSGTEIVMFAFVWQGCDNPITATEDVYATRLFSCSEDCFTCHADCSGRECGPDGCGGSCGTCLSTQSCNAAGHCGSAGDTCSACLATCQGYDGCCTGCGCMCEDECGDCF